MEWIPFVLSLLYNAWLWLHIHALCKDVGRLNGEVLAIKRSKTMGLVALNRIADLERRLQILENVGCMK